MNFHNLPNRAKVFKVLPLKVYNIKGKKIFKSFTK